MKKNLQLGKLDLQLIILKSIRQSGGLHEFFFVLKFIFIEYRII
jgi:hypothetical protein